MINILMIIRWLTLGFQEGRSPLMEQMIFFHDHTIVIIILIISIVRYIIISLVFNSFINTSLLERQRLEVVWTLLPAIILLFIAFPSLRLLYLIDEVNSPRVTLKVIGHQWYWRYEYTDFWGVEFDSYIVGDRELEKGRIRVLEVDSRRVIPLCIDIRVLVTAADVIHAWTIPRLGVKVDAIPGRLNQLGLFRNRPGVIYGQCSEICGANHSFIPIVVEVVSVDGFLRWLKSFCFSGWKSERFLIFLWLVKNII